jgi:hypothetical protein
MIEHGRRRGAAFTVEKITQLWALLLFQTIPTLALAHPSRYGKGARTFRHLWQKFVEAAGLARLAV